MLNRLTLNSSDMRTQQDYKHCVGGTVWQVLHSSMNNLPYYLNLFLKK